MVDTQPCLALLADPREVIETLTWCLEAVLGWISATKLKLNPNKTKVLLLGGSSDSRYEVSSVLDEVALP